MGIDIFHFEFNPVCPALYLSNRVGGFLQKLVQAVSNYFQFITGINLQHLCQISIIRGYFKNLVIDLSEITLHSDRYSRGCDNRKENTDCH